MSASLSQSRGSGGSQKRKSGDFDDLNNENLANANPSRAGGAAAAKKAKANEPSTPSSAKMTSTRPVAKTSALPRFTASTRTRTGSTAAAPTATPVATPAPAPVIAVASQPTTTPRKPTAGRAAAITPGRPRMPNLDTAVQDALGDISFNTIKGKLDSTFSTNNDRMATISNSLKMKTKSFDTKEKMKRQENALKDFKDLVTAVNEDIQATIESCDTVDKKLTALVTKSMQQRFEDVQAISVLREKEADLQRLKESIAEERGSFKSNLLQMQLNYDDKVHKLESRNLGLEKELIGKEKEMMALETQLSGLRSEYENTVKAGQTSAEQRAEALTSKFSSDLHSMQETLRQKEEQVAKLVSERDELQAQQRGLHEEVMKLNMTMESSGRMSTKQEEEMLKMVAEVDRLRVQVTQKDEDLRATMNSVREMQRQAQDEKNNFWTEFGALNAKFQACEDERRGLFSQLAEKREEVALLLRDLQQLQAAKQELEDKVSSQDAELVDSKELKVQLEIEKKLRLKCEMHEENERRERTAAVAQLMAVQAESNKRVQEIEESAAAMQANLGKEIELLTQQSELVSSECKSKANTIAGLHKEVENLHLALENASTNHKSFEELSRASGEVEVLRRRLDELTRDKEAQAALARAQLTEINEKLNTSEIQRRKLHNLVQELRGNIRVFARVRPFLPNDGLDLRQGQSPPSAISVRAELNSLQILPPASNGDSHRTEETGFSFDKVFGQSTSQDAIFEEVSEFVQSALDGYNVCLFSYGQTGSGKTHTMNGSGSGSMRGIIPRAMEQVGAYRRALQEKGWEYQMEVSFLEIYNENIRDLLRGEDDTDAAKHEIKRDLQNNVFVSDIVKMAVDPDNQDQINAIMETAAQHRSVCSTKMNERSSRSHAIFTLYLTACNAGQGIQLSGSLNLVDLAGSERLDRSGVTGAALKETVAINKSLSSLADVFNALAKKQPHVPYRNSKLTHLLQPCLSGDGKTLMIVNLSPTEASYHESLSSLRFANQVNQCELGKPKRRLKDVAADAGAKGASTPVALSASMTESMSAKKPGVPLSASLTKLDDIKENMMNVSSASISMSSISEKAPLSAMKKRPVAAVKASSSSTSAKVTTKPPMSKR